MNPVKILLLIVLLLYFNPINAQSPRLRNQTPFDFSLDTNQSKFTEFEGDTTAPFIKNQNNKIIDSIFKLNRNYDFEFRFWTIHSMNNADHVFILTLKNNKWNARYFDHRNEASFTERKVNQELVDHLWTLLLNNNVLTLPSQSSLQDKLVTYVVDSNNIYGHIQKTSLTDGVLYSFELSKPNKKDSIIFRTRIFF